jgi:hypothetical protein
MSEKQLCVISYGEWFPYYDLDPIENTLDAGEYDKVIELDIEDYLVYKGLLTQMERLQYKLEKLHERGLKP